MKTELEQALEWWTRDGFNGTIEQQKVGKMYYPEGFNDFEDNVLLIWKKEVLEKRGYNETFNPEAHSSLIIDFDKVETIEEAAEKYQKQDMIGHNIQYRAYRAGAKSKASKNHWFKIFQEEQRGQDKHPKN